MTARTGVRGESCAIAASHADFNRFAWARRSVAESTAMN
jgi:hypothetical protein